MNAVNLMPYVLAMATGGMPIPNSPDVTPAPEGPVEIANQVTSPTIFRSLVTLPATISTAAWSEACSNSPGPLVKLDSELELPPLAGRFFFRVPREGGNPELLDIGTAEVLLIAPGEKFHFLREADKTLVTGNPRIFIQFLDSAGNTVSDEILLGRCVQGTSPISLDFLQTMHLDLDVRAANCTHSDRYIILNGEVMVSGLNARVIFRDANRDMILHQVTFPLRIDVLNVADQMVMPRATGDILVKTAPYIFFQFAEPDGRPLGAELPLGRCVSFGT